MRKSKVLTFSLTIVLLLLILIFPDISSEGVLKGLMISANVVVPSLFPFIFCVLIIIKNDFYFCNKFVDKFLYKLFGQNSKMFFVFFLSLIGGYPIGAKLICELYDKKTIDTKTANTMLTYCVNAGPAFVVAVVGGVLKSKILGIILLVSHIFSSIIIALLNSNKIKRNNTNQVNYETSSKTFSKIFIISFNETISSILSICGMIMLFSMINSYLDYFFGDLSILKYISLLTEVTTAVTKTHNIYFVSFLLGFAGISIWCQIFALTNKIALNKIQFIAFRLIHGTISAVITKVLVTLLEIKIPTYSNNIGFKNIITISNTSLFFSMTIMLILLFAFIYSKNNSGKIINDMI